MIQPIVEGQGEAEAVPILLRRIAEALGVYGIAVNRPIRKPRAQLVRESDFRAVLQLAQLDPNLQALLVLFDSDDDCARDVIPNMKVWAQEEVASAPYAIVMARREYEAWFLAAIESLRGQRRIRADATYTGEPEARRDMKGALNHLMPKNQPYSETADQPALSAKFDLAQAYRRSSSFRKLVAELNHLFTELGYNPTIPDEWTTS